MITYHSHGIILHGPVAVELEDGDAGYPVARVRYRHGRAEPAVEVDLRNVSQIALAANDRLTDRRRTPTLGPPIVDHQMA